jgi:hypothetical protein
VFGVGGGVTCFRCGARCDSGEIFTVRNEGRMLCSSCSRASRVPLFTATDLKFDQSTPAPALPPLALCDWTIAHTSVLGIPASGVRIVWRCDVVEGLG